MSTTPAAAGPISVPKRKLCEALAETQPFQERAGLTYPDASAATKLIDDAGTQRIFYPTADARDLGDLIDRAPYAVIDNGNAWSLTVKAGGNQNHLWPEGGQLRLILVDRDRYPNSLEQSKRDFENFVGQTLQALAALAALDARIAITRIAQEHAPALPPHVADNAAGRRFWSCAYLVDWE